MAPQIEIFELVINAFVALAGIVFCSALAVRENRQRIHVLTAIFTGLVTLGTFARMLFWLTQAPAWLWLTYFFFALFPLAALLFFEALSGQRPRAAVKLLFLFFSIATVTALLAVPSIAWNRPALFLIPLATAHAITVFTGLALLTQGVRSKDTTKQLRSIQWAVGVFLIVTIPFLTLDWLNNFGFHTPRLGPVAILLLIHTLFRVFNARGNFTLRTEIAQVGSTLFGLACFALTLNAIEGSTEGNRVVVIAFLALLCQIPANFMRHYWTRIRSVGQASTIERINRLPRASSLEGFTESLNSLEEIDQITWVSPLKIRALGLGTKTDLKSDLQGYYSLSELEAKFRTLSVEVEARSRAEFFRHLLLTSGGTSLIPISSDRGFLSIRFSPFMQESYYRELGTLLASMAALQPLSRLESSATDMIASFRELDSELRAEIKSDVKADETNLNFVIRTQEGG